MWMTDLATIARSTGRPVVEQPNWRTRGHAQMSAVRSVVVHHTATKTLGEYPSLNLVTNGRSDLPGPLCNFGIGRTGTIYVIAAGLAYHAGATIDDSLYSNKYSIGIECENNGVGEVWSSEQLLSIRLLCRALADWYKFSYDRVQGHKEICKPAGRKIDPANFSMPALRTSLKNPALVTQEDDMTPEQEARQIRIESMLSEVLTQLYGPRDNTGIIKGWPQLGNRTLVDAVGATMHTVTDEFESGVPGSSAKMTPRDAWRNTDAYGYLVNGSQGQVSADVKALAQTVSNQTGVDKAAVEAIVKSALADSVVKVDVSVQNNNVQ